MLNIQKNIKLSDYSTFRIGGEAKFFVEAKNEEELLEAINYAKENNLKFFILGGGSNILFADEGFDGIIIKIQNTKYQMLDTNIDCGAGLLLSQAVNIAKDNSLSGLEWASGIPGTVGGAIRGNAGAFGSDMSSVILEVKAYDISESRIMNYESSSCDFEYRDSIFKQNNNLIIISAKIKLEKGNRDEMEARMKEIISKRIEKQPKGFSSGSFFKNPVVENRDLKERFESETESRIVDGKIPAGWLIDRVNLLGKKIGGAMVSEKNGNFIINNGNATSKDIIALAGIIKQEVKNKFGVELEEEIKYISY
jgi:UDP-N-acetylmuramate dehydrogenase